MIIIPTRRKNERRDGCGDNAFTEEDRQRIFHTKDIDIARVGIGTFYFIDRRETSPWVRRRG